MMRHGSDAGRLKLCKEKTRVHRVKLAGGAAVVLLVGAALLHDYQQRNMLTWFDDGAAAYARDSSKPLHMYSQWSYYSEREWAAYTAAMLHRLCPRLQPGDGIYEVGCGVGAILQQALVACPTCAIAGSDLSVPAIDVARRVLPQGTFSVGDGRALTQEADNSYHHVLSNGVIAYVRDMGEADSFVREMVRITKPGGSVSIMTLVQPGEQGLGSYHLYFDSQWFHDNAAAWGVHVHTIEREKTWPGGESQHQRYAVFMTKKPAGGAASAVCW